MINLSVPLPAGSKKTAVIHGVGKKSFLADNPLPILNTWRHVLSMG